MLKNPQSKYQASPVFNFPERTWVNNVIQQAPIWLSTDLRDGNQSLFNPMNIETKLKFYNEIVKVGVKEIEVGFPAASEIDFKFVHKLIDEQLIPEDVTIMVMTQARKDLIDKTVAALSGAKRAIVHIYNATAPAWREIVFGMSIEQVRELVKTHISYFKQVTDNYPQTEWILQYSPETFSATEPEVALDICNLAIDTWEVSATRKIIINLPTTVENTTPNVFADKIEWMNNNLSHREHVILSVHPHNDRGTGVATAELALLAGADRVEGCLFGNGERCGNVDLVTLALNLYTQGVSPNLDFSNINHVAKIVEECTQLPIHPRHPYVGDLVFTAFSGSHQDAIKKGFAYQKGKEVWSVPYLPIDPSDLGRTYDNIIRVNSQSGKGGIAYILEHSYGINLPRRMQIEFSSVVQKTVDNSEAELTSEEIWQLFNQTYLKQNYAGAMQYVDHVFTNGSLTLSVLLDGQVKCLIGSGEGLLEAVVCALNQQIEILNYEEKSTGHTTDSHAVTIIECQIANAPARFGVGISQDISVSSICALLSAVNNCNC